MKSCQGFGDSSDWVFDSQRRGWQGSLLLCAPLGSLPSPPPLEPQPELEPEPEPELEPSPFGAAAPAAACASHLPKVGDTYAQPSSDPFSPDEDRRRPAFPLSIFSSSSCWSHSCSRCHLKTPRPGGGRGRGERGKKKSQKSVNCACARAVVGPQTGNQSPLPPPPEITFWDLFFSAGCHMKSFFLRVGFFSIVSAPMTKWSWVQSFSPRSATGLLTWKTKLPKN